MNGSLFRASGALLAVMLLLLALAAPARAQTDPPADGGVAAPAATPEPETPEAESPVAEEEEEEEEGVPITPEMAAEAEETVEYTDADFAEVEAPAADAGILRYGADLEGGVPYIYDDPENPGTLIGFEVEIMDYIGGKLGRKPVFVQNDWDKLIPGLTRDLYEMAIQGQEITPEHEEAVAFSVPYYVTALQLCVRQDTFAVSSLADCRGKTVGVLKASLSYYILADLGGVDIRAYSTEVNGFNDLENGRLDAVLFDGPVALYYGGPRPGVKFIKQEIGRISYGFAFPADDPDLLARVNEILMEMRGNGELRRILDRWNLWNPLVAAEFGDYGPPKSDPVMYDQWVAQQGRVSGFSEKLKRYIGFLPVLGKGALLTLEVSLLSMLLAIVLGFFLATVRVYAPRPLSLLATLYIEIIRGTPVLIQLFFIFYGLPSIGIRFSPFWAGVVGLGMNYAAYEAENYRAGFISVPHSQMEAALALAMSRWQSIRHVIAPQAFRVVLPPVTNDFISLLKDSSLVSIITMIELTKTYQMLAITYYDYFGTGLMVAAIYLLLGLPFVRLARWTEKKLAVAHPGVRR